MICCSSKHKCTTRIVGDLSVSGKYVRAKWRFTKAPFLLLVVIFAGCSWSGENDKVAHSVAALNCEKIQRLANLYLGYQARHSWQGPKDEVALRSFALREMDPKKLEMMQIDPFKLDDLFVSPRDHKPFKVKYGVNSLPGANVPVVFEDTGVGGRRQVGFTGPMVEEVDEKHYSELWDEKAPTETGVSPLPRKQEEEGSGSNLPNSNEASVDRL
jgi:hypothetical protein